MARDRDYNKLINCMRWRRLRNERLSRHPLCEQCEKEGRLTYATEVHHITPVETGLTLADKERLAYNPSNLIALCHDCHVKAHKALLSYSKSETKRREKERLDDFKRFLFGN